MVASKITPNERLLRKRANARLRQQRCRARKKVKMEKQGELLKSEGTRDHLRNLCHPHPQTTVKKHRLVFPNERDFKKQFYRNMYSTHPSFDHGSTRDTRVNPVGPQATGLVPKHLRSRENNHTEESMGENDLRQAAIEAMLSLRSNSEDSHDSTHARNSPPAVEISKQPHWQQSRSELYGLRSHEEKCYASYKETRGHYNCFGSEHRRENSLPAHSVLHFYTRPEQSKPRYYHRSDLYSNNPHNFVQLSYH